MGSVFGKTEAIAFFFSKGEKTGMTSFISAKARDQPWNWFLHRRRKQGISYKVLLFDSIPMFTYTTKTNVIGRRKAL